MLEEKEKLVLSCEKLVLSIVNKYASSYNREDLYQVGMEKLESIVSKYNSNLGVKFSTYAYDHILGAILDYIRKDKNLHISRDVISLTRKINIAIDHYYKSFGHNPNTEELSKILGVEENKIIKALNINQNTESLDKTYDEDENITLADKIYIKESVEKEDLISLKYALKELNEEDRNLIYQRYFEDRSQTEIAKEMNISQVKVYRMERKILDELNDMIKAS